MLDKTKAQAALEYLITYGWALVTVATIVGVLMFLGGGGVNTESCTTFLSFVCTGIGVDGDTLIMVLQNASGQKISINPFDDICFDGRCGYASIEYKNTRYRFETVEIDAGAEFKVFGEGQVLASEMSITYTEEQTGLEKTVNSKFGSGSETNIEISNDGIDNDGDGEIDCGDTPTDCEYPVAVVGPNETTQTPITLVFNSEAISYLRVNGDWDVKGAYIYFYVTEVSEAGVKAQIQTSQYDDDITTGWNSVLIEDFERELTFSSIILDASSGSFTIEGANLTNAPKLVLIIEKHSEGEGG